MWVKGNGNSMIETKQKCLEGLAATGNPVMHED